MFKRLTNSNNLKVKLAFIGSFVVIGFATLIPVFAASNSNITINFSSLNSQPLSPDAFSGTISTYKGDGQTITNNKTVSGNLYKLGLSTHRVPIQFNNGKPISSAGNGPTDITADAWIASIKSLGAEPEIVIGGSPSQPGSHDNNFSPVDAAGLVKYFNTHAFDTVANGATVSHYNPVKYWVIGNEPADLTAANAAAYCSIFNTTVDAMKAVDPTVIVVGPAISSLNTVFMQAFLRCAGSKVDVVDYHEYAMGYTYLDNATALARTNYYSQKIAQLRDLIVKTVPAYANHIKIQVGEYNFTYRTADGYPGYQGDDRLYQPILTVWTASVAGQIAQSGAIGHNYSDMSLPLLIRSGGDAAHFNQTTFAPMPGYYGLEMFTGGDLFRRFGTQMVTTSTTLPNTEIYASTNQKNIVLINKDPSVSQTARVALNGFKGGSADVWQTNANLPFAAPKLITKLNGLQQDLTATLAPYTVTTIVLNENTGVGPPVPPPSAPNVGLVSPQNGASLSNLVTLSATASDALGVAKVEFYVDNSLIGSTSVVPYQLPWDTSHLPNTSYKLFARVYNRSGVTTDSSPVTVTVVNNTITPGATSYTTPDGKLTTLHFVPGQKFSKSAVAFQVVPHGINVKRMTFSIDGRSVHTEAYAPWCWTGDTNGRCHPKSFPVPSGNHTMVVRAYDTKNKVVASATLSFSN